MVIATGSRRPFAGIKVLDLTRVVASPFTSYQLGLLGAEVTKIEDPQSRGDTMRYRRGSKPEYGESGMATFYLSQSANKKSMTLDLRTAEGRTIFRQMAMESDVLIENLRRLAEQGGEIMGYLPLSDVHSPLFGRVLASSGFAVGGGVLRRVARAAGRAPRALGSPSQIAPSTNYNWVFPGPPGPRPAAPVRRRCCRPTRRDGRGCTPARRGGRGPRQGPRRARGGCARRWRRGAAGAALWWSAARRQPPGARAPRAVRGTARLVAGRAGVGAGAGAWAAWSSP